MRMDTKQKHNIPPVSGMPESDFFEEQRHQIWVKAMENETQSNDGFLKEPLPKVRYAAVFIAFISAAGFILFSAQQETCESFICLWEATDKKSLQISETELEQWLLDDELFWEISESL